MPKLLEQLIRDHGDEITRKISGTLGVTRDEAGAVLSATAPVILGRFESAKVPIADGGESLDQLLEGTGEQMNVRIREETGVTPEQAAKVIPVPKVSARAILTAASTLPHLAARLIQ